MSKDYVDASDLNLLADQMNKKNAAFLKDRKFQITTKKTDTAVYVTVTLANDDESFYYPLEMRINFNEEEMNALKAALFLIDYADLYFEDYLASDDELFVPIDWCTYEYEAVQFQLRGQIFNRKLERMADDLLAETSLNS